MGTLYKVVHELPAAHLGGNHPHPDEEELDSPSGQRYQETIAGDHDRRWVGVVKRSDHTFTGPGDSGALVYAIEDSCVVPLGIHICIEDGDSIFLSIETFMLEGILYGLDLQFA